jgi:hypothetical protein
MLALALCMLMFQDRAAEVRAEIAKFEA